jgi:D-threo-aldose 1-dehydrogenase
VTEPKLILLHQNDNVLVCVAPIAAGESIEIDGAVLHAVEDIGVGHKVARRAIWPEAKILKYGAPIGSATQTIAAGEWVHSHNMASDYIPAHGRRTATEGISA